MPLTLAGTVLERPRLASTDEPDRLRRWLDEIRSGTAFRASEEPRDGLAHLLDAFLRARGCPDLFLIDADPTERQTILEWFAESATPASRVLIVTPDRDFADRLVAKLGERALRAVGPCDDGWALPRSAEAIRCRCTSNAAERLHQLHHASEVLDRLRSSLTARAELSCQRERIAAEMESDPGFQDEVRQLLVRHAEDQARLASRGTTLTARRQELASARDAMVSVDAPGLFTRLLHRRQIADRHLALASLDEQIQTVLTEETQVQAQLETMLREQAIEREQHFLSQVASRTAAIDNKLASLNLEIPSLSESCREASEILTHLGLKFSIPDGSGATAEFSELESLTTEVERSREEIQRNLAGIADPESGPARGLLDEISAVVAVPEACGFDDAIRDAAFDVLLLDEAQSVDESAFFRMAELTKRWVLLGQSRSAQDAKDFPFGRLGVRSRFSKGDTVAIDVFTRLAGRLNQEPWLIEGDRLVRRILPLTDLDPRPLVEEPLLDRPEISLRFLTDDGEPRLAEVAFPAAMPTVEAKAFLFASLGEVLLRPVGESHTHDEPDAVIVCWPAVDRAGGPADWIDLEPGIREKVLGDGPHAFTTAVSFDRAHGWTAERAAAWLADHLPTGSPSRVAVLPRTAEYAEELAAAR